MFIQRNLEGFISLTCISAINISIYVHVFILFDLFVISCKFKNGVFSSEAYFYNSLTLFTDVVSLPVWVKTGHFFLVVFCLFFFKIALVMSFTWIRVIILILSIIRFLPG